ncbi:MAG: VWA domain-containing protein [Geodermatophilaceae bacterium]|nr:VWA domain-containing protein [Geodermatophilaceae bacterium]
MPRQAPGPARRDVVETLLIFVRTLRVAGVEAGPDRVQAMIAAVGELDVLVPSEVYWAGRFTLCSGPDDLARYDVAFASFFGGEAPRAGGRQNPKERQSRIAAMDVDASGSGAEDPSDDEGQLAVASAEEILRTRDIASLTPAEREQMRLLFGLIAVRPPTRPSRRHTPAHRGRVDVPRTVRRMLRNGGELRGLSRQRARTKPRRVVLLVDISGSMSPYADAVLRFAHSVVRRAPASSEVFTIGTRLTRVTRELRQRDPDKAIQASGQAIPDWSGGTRLGEVIKAFLDRWGQRGTARRATVVVFSDGWERGDCGLLAEQMQRLSRLAHAVIWVNPHKGRLGYEPLTGGIQAVLPHVSSFVAGHSLAAFQELVEEMADA